MQYSHLFKKLTWTGLVALLTGLYVWLPFWISAFLGRESTWWRVPTVHGTMFDSHMYLTWVGYIQAGIPFANNLGWYKYVLAFLDTLTQGQASVAELWLLSAWLSSFLSALVVYFTGKKIIHLERNNALLLTLAWWLSVSAHSGWRPGVYSWYIAIGFLAVALILRTSSTTFRRYLALLAALLLGSVYPWFLIPLALWVGAEVIHLHAANQRVVLGLWSASVAGSIGAALVVTHLWPTQLFHTLEVFTRYGLGFTHLPFLSTSLLTVIGWITILLISDHSSAKNTSLTRSLLTGWLVTFFCFELSPFTGIVFQNDHFRAIILLLSWLSLFQVVSSFSSLELQQRTKQIIPCIAALSAVFIIWKSARLVIHYHDDLSIIQVAYWLPLLGGSIYLAFPAIRQHFAIIFVVASLPFTIFAAQKVIQREIARPQTLREQAHLRDEIMAKVDKETRICTDPGQANRIASFIPRLILPAVTYRFLPESEQAQQDFLRAYAYGWQGQTKIEQQAHLERLIAQDQYLPCNRLTEKFLKSLGLTEKQIDPLTGCPRNSMKTALYFVTTDFPTKKESERAFAKACPWILIPPKQTDRWRIPTEAKTYPLSNGTLLIKLPQETQESTF